MRRFGNPPQRHHRYPPRPGAYAVILGWGQILVTQANSLHGAEIQLPGGGIDPGESSLQALHREAMEETGYTIHSPRRLGRYQRFTYMPDYDRWAQKICHIYLCRPGLKRGAPKEAHHEAKWMDPLEALHALSSKADAHFVARQLGICARFGRNGAALKSSR